MSQYINLVYQYLEKTYVGRVIRDEITRKFWEFYLTDDFEFNPKYFKFTGSWQDSDGRESVISVNLPDSIVRQAGKKVTEKNYQEIKKGVINSIVRQAVISEFQKKEKLDYFPRITRLMTRFPAPSFVPTVVGTSEGQAVTQACPTMRKRSGIAIKRSSSREANLLYFIQMEKINAKNIFQHFFAAPLSVPRALLDFPKLMGRLSEETLPDELAYDDSILADRTSRAEKGLRSLAKITGIKKTTIRLPKYEYFVEKNMGVLYSDCTPHNFMISVPAFDTAFLRKLHPTGHPSYASKRVSALGQDFLKIVDIETMGNFYLDFSLAYNLIYFLIHLPFLNAQPERKTIIDGTTKLASDKSKFQQALIVCFLAHAAEVIEFSKSRDEQALHKNLVMYNTTVAKKILSGVPIHEALI